MADLDKRVRFSARTDGVKTPSPWASAVAQHRESGAPLIDLTASNPTTVGLPIDRRVYAAALADGARHAYEPNTAGLDVARRAIADYYAARGAAIAPEQIFITASTSEAYGAVLTILTDPGDPILVPTPSYPLLDTLARLRDVRLVPYALGFNGAMFSTPCPDVAEDVRAIVVVTPNNPTGHHLRAEEDDRLTEAAQATGAALIADEVFLDSADIPRSFARRGGALRFTLSGLSKIAGLPDAKLSWIVVSGPAAEAEEAIARLEVVLDAQLSVSSAVQHALPALLLSSNEMQANLRRRLRRNRRVIVEVLTDAGVRVLPAEAGWSTIVIVDDHDDEALALELLEAGVIVEPGFLYDLPFDGGLVLSTLVPERTLDAGLERLARAFSFGTARPLC